MSFVLSLVEEDHGVLHVGHMIQSAISVCLSIYINHSQPGSYVFVNLGHQMARVPNLNVKTSSTQTNLLLWGVFRNMISVAKFAAAQEVCFGLTHKFEFLCAFFITITIHPY